MASNSTSNTQKNGNGLRLVMAVAAILLTLGIQIVAFTSQNAATRAKMESFQDRAQSDIGEIKFRVGNIEEGVNKLQNDGTRFMTKCEEYDRRFNRLESHHGVSNP